MIMVMTPNWKDEDEIVSCEMLLDSMHHIRSLLSADDSCGLFPMTSASGVAIIDEGIELSDLLSSDHDLDLLYPADNNNTMSNSVFDPWILPQPEGPSIEPSGFALPSSQTKFHDECGRVVAHNSSSSKRAMENPAPLLDNSSDNSSDGIIEEEETVSIRKPSRNVKNPSSKNLVSERRRRKKLNDRLFSLRAIVPNITKMDKASVVSDAISYVQELQKQVQDIKADIQRLQDGSTQLHNTLASKNIIKGSSSPLDSHVIKEDHKEDQKKIVIVELGVFQMEGSTYNLHIHCKKEPAIFVQLARALEALDFEIVNANLNSVNDHALTTVVVKVKNGEVLETNQLKTMILDIAPKFSLHV